MLHERLSAYEDVIYLESGNSGVELPDPAGLLLVPSARTTGDRLGGPGAPQCQKWRGTDFPSRAEQIPDLVGGDEVLPKEVPCGRALESLPQWHMTNLVTATVLMISLTPLLGDGTPLHHAASFDARAGT